MKRPIAFRNFYPGDCRQEIDELLRAFEPGGHGEIRAAVVPHAGWRFSGAVAARTIRTLGESRPESLLLLSAVHRRVLERPALYPSGSWDSPLGEVPVDEELAREISRSCGALLAVDPEAHSDEHALEVIVPFIKALLPGTPIVPLMAAPEASPVELGLALAEVVGERPIAAIASTDFTHYGSSYGFTPEGVGPSAHEWMRRNDRRLIDLALELKAEEIVPEARSRQSACGAGALAAAVAYARSRGAREGALLERTDSHEVRGAGEPFTMAVGYAGIVW